MKKKTQSKNKTSTGKGPIARKVIASVHQHFQEKITNLSDWRDAKIQADNFQKTVISKHKLTEYDPLHGVYIYAQNQLSVLIELIIELPMLDKLADTYSKAEEEYMPSGPPMSPLTTSYFTFWGTLDLCSSGAKKETLCTIVTDLCRFLKVDEGLITLLEKMQTSRMGIYKHEGVSDQYVYLREIITNEKIKAISPSGYLGRTGEIWFARVFPPPFDIQGLDYSVVITTPYVLGKSGSRKEFIPHVEGDWLAFFNRNLPKMNAETSELAYAQLMKYGLNRNYWNEYVFLAYRNHQHDVIYLDGIPDIPSSLPHSNEGKEKLGF